MNLRKDHYRKTFSSSKKWKEPHRTIGFKSQNGEGSTLSNLGSADDFVRATFDSDGLRVGEPNAKKILLGVEEATHFLGYLKRAGQPIAPRIVLFLFSLSICVAYFFFALEIHSNANLRSCWPQHCPIRACPSFLLPATRLSHKLVKKNYSRRWITRLVCR